MTVDRMVSHVYYGEQSKLGLLRVQDVRPMLLVRFEKLIKQEGSGIVV